MDKIKLTCKPLLNGIMAYWDGAKEAAGYIATLYVNGKAISVRTLPRTELYCSFTGLAAIDGVTTTITDIISHAASSVMSSSGFAFSSPKHSGLDYFVQIEAESREGKIIARSDRVECSVKEF